MSGFAVAFDATQVRPRQPAVIGRGMLVGSVKRRWGSPQPQSEPDSQQSLRNDEG